MSSYFKVQPTGIPLTVMPRPQFSHWLEQQSSFVQNWAGANTAEEAPHIAIPDASGALAEVLAFLPDDGSYFIAGNLPESLPLNHYVLAGDLTQQQRVQFAISWGLASYRFDRYCEQRTPLPTLGLASDSELEQADDFVSAIALTRDLINTPASDMMPGDLAETMAGLAKEFNGQFSELIGDQLLEANYPTIHAVGRASIHEPRLLDLKWGASDAPKITLIGKGVCFDSGGLNLKPGNFMRLMKKDMGGAAHVIGLARLIMARKLPIQLRVLVAAAENAVSSNAFRPGDVIKTRKGITVEIDNTDAEGRLVLCDALTEADDEHPELIIDFATLTGACRVALGTEVPGYFCNDEEVASALYVSSLNSNDPIWRLPLHKPYEEMLKSQIADTLNSSASGFGGAITAALYLQKFVSKDTPWVHFDVMAWNDRKQAGRPIGGDAFGLRAVFDYLQQRFTTS